MQQDAELFTLLSPLKLIVALTVSAFLPKWLGFTVNYERHSKIASDETKHLNKIKQGRKTQAKWVKSNFRQDFWTTLGALVFIRSPVIPRTNMSISVINHVKGNSDELIPKSKKLLESQINLKGLGFGFWWWWW